MLMKRTEKKSSGVRIERRTKRRRRW